MDEKNLIGDPRKMLWNEAWWENTNPLQASMPSLRWSGCTMVPANPPWPLLWPRAEIFGDLAQYQELFFGRNAHVKKVRRALGDK